MRTLHTYRNPAGNPHWRFPVNEYQSSSGEGLVQVKMGLGQERDAAGAKAHVAFAAFAARLKSCPVTRQLRIACCSR